MISKKKPNIQIFSLRYNICKYKQMYEIFVLYSGIEKTLQFHEQKPIRLQSL